MIDLCVGYVAVLDKKYAIPLGVACSNYKTIEDMEKELDHVEDFDYEDLRYDVEDLEKHISDDMVNEFIELTNKRTPKRKHKKTKKYRKKTKPYLKKSRKRHIN